MAKIFVPLIKDYVTQQSAYIMQQKGFCCQLCYIVGETYSKG